MPRVDFSQFQYYPALQSSVPELMAYRELSPSTKRRIVPVLELIQRGTSADLNNSITEVRASTGTHPFILDLSKEPAPAPYRYPGEDPQKVERDTESQAAYNNLLSALLNQSDGFSAWRELAESFDNAIPVLQFTDPSIQRRQILRQAALLSHGDQSLAIRITEEHADTLGTLVPQIISILRSPAQLLVIIDCGQRRQRLAQRAQFAADTLTQILGDIDIAEQPFVQAVCMSSWYTKPDQQGLHTYEGQDWRLWREARDTFPFAFGDYGAMHRFRRRDTYVPSDWVATVTIPLDEGWRAYKHANVNDRSGWVTGAQLLRDEGSIAAAPACWGRDVVSRAANNDINGVDSARFWHASRVNIHITRQADVAYQNITNYGEDDDDDGP
jgi:hypothetical protein